MRKMDSKELFSQLLKGSRDINQMKVHISELVRLIIGYVRLHKWEGSLACSIGFYHWQVDRYKGLGKKDTKVCFVKSKTGRIIYTSSDGSALKRQDIRTVYTHLSGLVETASIACQEVESLCKQFVESSKVK